MCSHAEITCSKIGSVIGNLLSRVGLILAYPLRAHFINSDFVGSGNEPKRCM